MYAERELKRLGEVKARLRLRIALRRAEISVQTARVTQPLRWVDRALVYWKKAGPVARLAAGPVGVWLMNKLFARRKTAGSLMRWGPMIWNVVRGFRSGLSRRSPG